MAEIVKDNNKMHAANYHRTKMQKELVWQKLRENGFRITRQRQLLLDIILQEDCASCKEIYYKALLKDSGIGAATVYRMVNILEDIGAISRKNMYHISMGINENDKAYNECVIMFDDNTSCRLSMEEWYRILSEGLKNNGYLKTQKITGIVVESK